MLRLCFTVLDGVLLASSRSLTSVEFAKLLWVTLVVMAVLAAESLSALLRF